MMFAFKLSTNNNLFIFAFTQNQHKKTIEIAFNAKIYYDLVKKLRFSIHKSYFETVICNTDIENKIKIHHSAIRFDIIFFQTVTAKTHI